MDFPGRLSAQVSDRFTADQLADAFLLSSSLEYPEDLVLSIEKLPDRSVQSPH